MENFFTQSEPDWREPVGCTTDGAPSMLGRKSGFEAHVTVLSTTFHRRSLPQTQTDSPFALKCFFRSCERALNRDNKIVYFVVTPTLNARLFKLLCEVPGSGSVASSITEVRWLSRRGREARMSVSFNSGMNDSYFYARDITLFKRSGGTRNLSQEWLTCQTRPF